jgi:hypothetical protein
MSDWIKADIAFASLFSYRVPDTSPSYAPCAPLPSPAAIRLALVDAVIRHTGSVPEGQRVFELVKSAQLYLEPPPQVAIAKFFVRRLKPEKKQKGRSASSVRSTGIREYCVPSGPIAVWLKTDRRDDLLKAFGWLRRLGTTDSLAYCTIGEGEPDLSICMRVAADLPLRTSNFARRPVFTLHEIRTGATFEQVNPYEGVRRISPFKKQPYILPLIFETAGDNWVIYRREPFTQ